MSTEVIVSELPKCSFCERKAHYDARCIGSGQWAYLCELHFAEHTNKKLGTGYGQKLVLKEVIQMNEKDSIITMIEDLIKLECSLMINEHIRNKHLHEDVLPGTDEFHEAHEYMMKQKQKITEVINLKKNELKQFLEVI